MKDSGVSPRLAERYYNARFLEFIKRFVPVDRHEKLFPKECRTCGRTYVSLSHFLGGTEPKGHTLDDEAEVMGQPFTMTYRHCGCGNTLVLTLTEETYPLLTEMWVMLAAEAEKSRKPLSVVVTEFVDQWEHYMLTHTNSSKNG